MPELAEVAYACSQWDRGIGKYIKSIHVHPSSRVFRDLNRENLIKSLTGRKLTSSFTHGKQMLFRFNSDLWLGLHLGMTGSLHFEKSFYQKHKHDALVLFQSKWTLIFRDPRQFGRIRFHQGMNPPNWWSDLPLSILDQKYNKNILVDALARHSKRPIKALLLDQRYFQGIGNWMADEILWRAHIHPALPCGKINEKTSNVLFSQIRFVAHGAMKSIGLHGGDPPKGWLFHVRWKDGGTCPKTNKSLVRGQIGGRTSCWSPHLQKLPETISD